MSEMRIWHGGDLDEARRLFPGAPEPWIDLSTGINPVAYPLPELQPHLFERLPSPGALADLEAAATEAYGATDAATVAAAPGTQVLIGILPHLRPRSRVAVLGPTYAEHARSWRGAGHEVVAVASLDDVGDADVVVVVNPNNPDGRLLTRGTLLDRAAALHPRGGWLVVDEAFADFEDSETVVPLLRGGIVVLRSFGKTYGLAGLRLGFAIAERATASLLRAALGPWVVSGPAIEVGQRALRDHGWRTDAAKARADDARRLDALLRQATGATSTGTTLYRSIDSPCASDLFAHLGRRGLWTRRFKEHRDRLRLGLPGSGSAWMRLEEAIRTFGKSPRT